VEQDIHRLRLRVAAKLMLAVAFFAVLYVVLSVVLSTDPDSRVIPTQNVNIGDMQAGDMRIVLWEGRPVLVYRRTDQQQQLLQSSNPRLLDERSQGSRQPPWAENPLRSRESAFFISIAVGTDFSCPIKLLPASTEDFKSQPWPGGFVDECRGARYDFAGRVFSGQYADENLIVPAYRIDGDVLVLGG